ncbi:HTH domain-containing protein [Enterococcus faecalis]|nr:HTH domain-containing protein [Enterococcus faecalis]
MRNKIIKILRNSSTPIKGKELASKINVSDRTIRNYIKDINSTKKIIKSSQQGYSLIELNRDVTQYFDSPHLFQNQDERVLLIIEKIISSKNDSDLYDIAESLYISYSTIEKDVQLIKKIISSYNLSFARSKGKVSITGNESDKRLLINTLLRKSDSISINQVLEDMATNIGVTTEDIKKMLLEEVSKNHLYINDYAIKNIVIHVIIALSRIKNNNLLKDHSNRYDSQNMNLEIKSANNFIESLQTKYNIKFNDIEKEQLTFQIISKISRIDSDHETKYIVNEKYISFTKKIIEQINQLYYIDLNDLDFINFFQSI